MFAHNKVVVSALRGSPPGSRSFSLAAALTVPSSPCFLIPSSVVLCHLPFLASRSTSSEMVLEVRGKLASVVHVGVLWRSLRS